MNVKSKHFPCSSCGAFLKFSPANGNLTCEFCANEDVITSTGTIIEHNYDEKVVSLQEKEILKQDTNCTKCGANFEFKPHTFSTNCVYCDTPAVIEMTQDIKVESLLPFTIDRKDAKKRFKKWVSSRWFAPNAFKKYLNDNKILFGYYVPHWTYDSDTTSRYQGERGEYYYVTVTKTVVEDGKSREVEEQERRTDWYSVSGIVDVNFDDITVVASPLIPNKILDALEPWDTSKLVPFDDRYISGFDTQEYTTGLKDGFDIAKDKMSSKIDSAIRRDIGGDEQRIDNKDVTYNNTTYKNTLFPVWSATFKWNKKEYEYAINAQSGEVVGDRPYSVVKIALTVISVVAIIGLIIYYNR